MITCTKCGKTIDRLEVFPNNLCLDCYKTAPEATRPITAEELAKMWGGR